jgi:hypothetical protein
MASSLNILWMLTLALQFPSERRAEARSEIHHGGAPKSGGLRGACSPYTPAVIGTAKATHQFISG